jgi:hypothetical protein
MSKKRNWPLELKGPFPLQKMYDQAREAAADIGDPEHEDFEIKKDVRRLALAETKKRVALLANFFGLKWPGSEDGWLQLIFKICAGCEAPGFKVARKIAGAPKKWYIRNTGLFADVMSVVAKQKRPSEHAAVKHIVDNPTKFLNRYRKYKVKTLHRQFLRAKRSFEEQFDGGCFAPRDGRFLRREDAIRYDIEHYSAEAYRSR